jgi:hypothetical protein
MKRLTSINRKKTTTIEPNFEAQLMSNDDQSHAEIMAPEQKEVPNEEIDNKEITSPVETSTQAPDASSDVPVAPAIASSRKLSNEKALDILQRLDAGVKGSVLAKEYNVDSSTISDIKVGRLYKTVLADYKKSKETAVVTQP